MKWNEPMDELDRWVIGIVLIFMVVLFLMHVLSSSAHSAEPIHYTEWLAFTDDADRERQIDSVGAVVDTIQVIGGVSATFHQSHDGEISKSNEKYTYYDIPIGRQIAFVEIREWPDNVWVNSHLLDLAKEFRPGTFRVAWREER